VTDQGSDGPDVSESVSVQVSDDIVEELEGLETVFASVPRCRVCGRGSRWLEMEPW